MAYGLSDDHVTDDVTFNDVKLFNERQASNKRIEDSREAFQVKVFYAAIDTGILQIKEGTVYGQLKKFRSGQEL